MKIHIYKIYFPTSNKYYIGQTKYLKRRMSEHLGSKTIVGKALNKYDDWQVSILHTCKSRDIASLIEIEEIRNFNCVIPNGYNLTRGGEGNDALRSKETKEKNRRASTGNQNAKGFKHSAETIKKWLGNKNASVKRSEEFKKNLSKVRRERGINVGRKNTKEQMLRWHISRIKNQLVKLENE